MGSSKKPAEKGARTEGARAAEQIVFYSMKYRLMTQADLSRIGGSVNYHNLFLDVCQEMPAKMRALMQRAQERCSQGEEESKADRNKRKNERYEYIAGKRRRKGSQTTGDMDSNYAYTCASVFGDGITEAGASDANEDSDEEDNQPQQPQGPCDDDDNPDFDRYKPEEIPVDFDSNPEFIYQRELRLTQGMPSPTDRAQVLLKVGPKFSKNGVLDTEAAIKSVLKSCVAKLDVEFLKYEVAEYLQNCRITASTKQLPVLSDESSPEEIIDALSTFNKLRGDNSIRVAMAQTMLYRKVQKLCSAIKSHNRVLDDLAKQIAGNVSPRELEKIQNSYDRDYVGGRRWIEVMRMFGGQGTVIVFIVAKVGKWYVTQSWTELERAVLAIIAEFLPATRKLIACLGEHALDDYCKFGVLEQSVIERVKDIDVFDL